jgi:hypothetical protein
MTTILLVALASLGVYAVLAVRRHRCSHNDPLCRRERPCIACYRELYEGVVFEQQVSDLPYASAGSWSCRLRSRLKRR